MDEIQTDYEIVYDEIELQGGRPPKYMQGPVSLDFDDLEAAMDSGRRLWFRGRSYDRAFLGNMSWWVLRRAAKRGEVRYAVINPKYTAWLRAELAAVTEEEQAHG